MHSTDEQLRIQPHDLEAEQAVLGAILIEPTALTTARESLRTQDFYDSRHQRIFQAMLDLAAAGTALDLVSLGDRLDRNGQLTAIGGRGGVAELLTTVASASNIAHHCRIVADHAIRRRLISFTDSLSRQAYDKQAIDGLLQTAERGVRQIMTGREEGEWCALQQVAFDTANYVDRMHKGHEAVIGIPTGFADLDALLGGWHRSDSVVIAARPSMGKTAFVLGSALAAARAGFKVGFFSLEMSRLQIGLRLHGMGAPLDLHALKTGTLTSQGWWTFAETTQHLAGLPMWINDASDLSIDRVVSQVRQLQATQGLDLLIVDYLQLLQIPDAALYQRGIAEASRRLKMLAKELNVPVLVLSQLSRACESRPDRRPILADLRDSGAIEQDADIVIFLYRHEVYVPDTDEKGLAEVLVRKHRNGPIGDRKVRFIARYAEFKDLPEGTA